MRTLKRNLNKTVTSVAELIVGILLLVDPVRLTAGIIAAFGAALAVRGLIHVVNYFRTGPEEAAVRQLLARGLAELLAGVFCILRFRWFVVTFPVLTVVYGVVILFTGLTKLQWTVDMLRLKRSRWYLVLISAVLSIVCGVVIVTSPFGSTAVLWAFTGITLMIEAIFDIVAAFFGGREPDAVRGEEQGEGQDAE